MMNMVPCPTRLRISICAPCCSSTLWAMDSPSPVPSGLVVKKGVEDLREMLPRDAGPRVADVNAEVAAQLLCLVPETAFDRHGAALGHGLQGIEQDIDENLLDLTAVEGDVRGPGCELQHDPDPVLRKLGVHQGDGILDGAMDGFSLELRRRGSAEVEHPLYKVLDPLDPGQGIVDDPSCFLVGLDALGQQLNVEVDAGQGVANLVGDARGKLPQRREAVDPPHPLLRLLGLR